MNLTLAFRIVNVCAIALTVVNRVLIIYENSQNVRSKPDDAKPPVYKDSGT